MPNITYLRWAFSSAGRALPLQGRCRGFDPLNAHHLSSQSPFKFIFIFNCFSFFWWTVLALINVTLDQSKIFFQSTEVLTHDVGNLAIVNARCASSFVTHSTALRPRTESIPVSWMGLNCEDGSDKDTTFAS